MQTCLKELLKTAGDSLLNVVVLRGRWSGTWMSENISACGMDRILKLVALQR